MDDIILTTSFHALLKFIIFRLSSEFAIKDLGDLSYFLGIVITRHASSLFLFQCQYASEIIDKAGMSSCKSSPTPIYTKPKLGATFSEPYADPSHYCSLAGVLQYLTFTRPNISYAVQQVCLYMHNPREAHMHALKRIIRYLHGTFDHGLHIYPSSISTIIFYIDADWGGCPDT